MLNFLIIYIPLMPIQRVSQGCGFDVGCTQVYTINASFHRSARAFDEVKSAELGCPLSNYKIHFDWLSGIGRQLERTTREVGIRTS